MIGGEPEPKLLEMVIGVDDWRTIHVFFRSRSRSAGTFGPGEGRQQQCHVRHSLLQKEGALRHLVWIGCLRPFIAGNREPLHSLQTRSGSLVNLAPHQAKQAQMGAWSEGFSMPRSS